MTEFVSLVVRAQAGETTIPALFETLGVQPYLAQRLSSPSFGQRKRACLWRRSLAILCCSCWTSRATVLIPVASRWWWILSDRGVSRGWRRLWRPMTRHFAQALSARCLRIAKRTADFARRPRQRGSVRRAKTVGWAAPFIEKWVAFPSDKIATNWRQAASPKPQTGRFWGGFATGEAAQIPIVWHRNAIPCLRGATPHAAQSGHITVADPQTTFCPGVSS